MHACKHTMSVATTTGTSLPFGLPSSPPCDGQRQTVGALFSTYEHKLIAQTNRLFWWLLMSQWIFAIFCAAVWSPRAWAGDQSSVHPHLIAAVGLGGLLVSLPLCLMRWLPYHVVTRHVIAAAQVSFSALLIHLTGGRIETHFHVFGSLAFLALYRDWRIMLTATLVVALDHLLRGLWYPSSVYGVPFATIWRTVEHSGWVIFEDVVLVWACIVSRREMWEICRRQDAYQQLLDGLEQRVSDRTTALEAEVAKHERTARELSQSEERYRALIANLPIGVFKTTRDGALRLANPYLLNLLGLPVDQDLAKINLADGRLLSPEARARFWQKLETDREARGFEATFRKTDGTVIDVVMNARGHGGPGETTACEGTLEDVTERKRAAREVETLHRQLVVASREAGMAEVATGVLHNVGNVLTSVNVTVHDVLDRLRTSRLSHLHQVVEVIQREQPRLASYLTDDPTGRQLPGFLIKLEGHLAAENLRLQTDVESLVRHFEHIREIIVVQQGSARLFGVNENLTPSQLFEDALKLIAQSLERHNIALERCFSDSPPVKADRHKVLQILVNLLQNAKDSIAGSGATDGHVVVRVTPTGDGFIAFAVEDDGPGISSGNLARIFQHGFTTKKNGHGFGLHSAVLAAREMGGDLAVASEGSGLGARFTLTLPLTPPASP
jgi:PAS domain S-box-containing protein